MRRCGLVLVGGLAAGCGGGGDGGGGGGPPVITSVVVTGDSTVILAGTRQLNASAFAGSTPVSSGVTFEWLSSDTTYVLVTPNGEVWGFRLGSSNITATAVLNGTRTNVTSPPHGMRTRIGRISITTTRSSFDALGETAFMEAKALDATNGVVPFIPFAWTSRAPSVASVTPRANDSFADLAALGNGTARMVVTGDGVSDSITITVQQVATALSISPNAATLHSIGQTLTPTVTASDFRGNPVPASILSWTSGNTQAATVNTSSGVVTAVNEGQSNVVAASGSVADTIAVTVDQIPATITITPANFETPDVTMKTNQTAPFYATVLDSLGQPVTRDSVTWSTDAAAVADVAGTASLDSTVVTTFALEGAATITAAASPVSASRVVNVSAIPISFATQVATVFTGAAGCDGCHPPSGGLNLTAGLAYADIVGVSASQVSTLKRVRPFRPDSSYLIHKLQGTQSSAGGFGARMPFGCAGATCLSNTVINTIRNWILQGALNN